MTETNGTPTKATRKRRPGRHGDGIQARQTTDGRTFYMARVVVVDPETHKRRELTRNADSYNAAVEARRELQEQAKKIADGVLSLSAAATLGDLLARFERDVLALTPVYDAHGTKLNEAYAPRLLVSIRAHLAKFRAFFGTATPVKSITPARLKSFREYLLAEPVTFHVTRGNLKGELARDRGKLSREEFERLTPEERAASFPAKTRPRTVATANRCLSFLRRVLSFAVDTGAIEHNPFGRSTKLITKEQHRVRTLSLAEEDRLLIAASAEARAHLKPLLVLLLDTGLRISEALAIEWRDVNGATIDVRAECTKTRRARTVPVTTRAAAELERIRPANATGRVFGDLKSIRRSFATACKLAGITGLKIHDLRHTAGSRLAARLPVPEVANVLGHVSLETTRKYLNPTAERMHRAAEALEAYQTEERAKLEEANAEPAEPEKVN